MGNLGNKKKKQDHSSLGICDAENREPEKDYVYDMRDNVSIRFWKKDPRNP